MLVLTRQLRRSQKSRRRGDVREDDNARDNDGERGWRWLDGTATRTIKTTAKCNVVKLQCGYMQ